MNLTIYKMSSFKRARICEDSDCSDECSDCSNDSDDSDESECSDEESEDSYTNNIMSIFSKRKQFYDNLYKGTNKQMYFIYLLDIGNSQIKFGCTEDFGRRFKEHRKKAFKCCNILGIFKTIGGPKIEKMIKQKFKKYLTTIIVDRHDRKECEIIQCSPIYTPMMVKNDIRLLITTITRNSKGVK